MPHVKINHATLVQSVQNVVNGLVAKIIQDETEKAKTAIQTRIAAETRGFVARIVSDQRDYNLNPEINVVISFPEIDHAQG